MLFWVVRWGRWALGKAGDAVDSQILTLCLGGTWIDHLNEMRPNKPWGWSACVFSRYTNWLFITIFLSFQLTRISQQRYCLITVPTELLQFFVTIRGLHQKPLRSPWWTCSLRYFGSGWWEVAKSKEPCLLWRFTLHPLGWAGRWTVLGLFWKKGSY